jgi:hypothetical protein
LQVQNDGAIGFVHDAGRVIPDRVSIDRIVYEIVRGVIEIHRLIDKYFALPTFETLGELNARMVEYRQATDSCRIINQ